MATGDPIAVTILANGWEADVDFEGLSGIVGTAAVDDFDSGYAEGAAPSADASNFYLTVTSEGYDATGALGTIERTVYMTRAQRKPYPDHADLQASVADTTNARVRFVLSHYVHDDDTATCVIKAALHASTNAGTPSVTNNSTEDYPAVTTAKWGTPAGQRLEGSFSPALFVKHPYGRNRKSVACVKFTLTDGAAGSVTETVTAPTTIASDRDPEGNPIKVEVWRPTLDVSGLAAGAATLRAQAYPWVGDADSVFDSSGFTFPAKKASQPHHIGGTVYYAYIAAAGNDGTGVASTTAATAKASPFLTCDAACDALNTAASGYNNCRLRIEGGHSFEWGRSGGSLRASDSAFIVVETDPDDLPTLGIIGSTNATLNNRDIRASRMTLADIAITPSGSSSNFFASGGAADDLAQLVRVVLTHSGSGTTLFASGVEYVRTFDCLFIDFPSGIGSDDHFLGEWQNCEHSFNINTASIVGAFFDLASNFGGSSVFGTSAAASFILSHIRLQNDASAIVSLGHAITDSYLGTSILKRHTSGTQPGVDANNVAIDGLHIEHATIAGCRVNPQNDGSPDDSQTGIYVNGLVAPYVAPKHDTFGEDGTLTGGWAMFFGVNYRNSFNGDAATFAFEYPGTNCISRVSGTDPEREADLYTDNNSVYGDDDGATFGDYKPLSDSDIAGLIPAGEASSAFDIFGNAVRNDGTGDAGAVQRTTIIAQADPAMATQSTFGRANRLGWGW